MYMRMGDTNWNKHLVGVNKSPCKRLKSPHSWLLEVSVESENWIIIKNKGKKHHWERLQGIICKQEMQNRLKIQVINFSMYIQKLWQGIKSLSSVEPKGFQQQMFAEKKMLYCFAEQFVFHELHSENGIIHHVKGTEQTRGKSSSSGNSECKRIGNHWKRGGEKIVCVCHRYVYVDVKIHY